MRGGARLAPSPEVFPAFAFVVGTQRVTIATYPLMLGGAVLAAAMLFVRRAPEPGWGIRAAAGIGVAGLGGARLLHLMLHGGGATIGDGGLSSMGGIAAAVAASVVAAWLGGHRAGVGLDALAPAGLLGLGIGRLGCFLAGCCYGRPTVLPWGVSLPDLGPLPRHPLQLYDAAGVLLLALVCSRMRPHPPGSIGRRACVGYGCLRAALEVLRDPAAAEPFVGGWLTLAQAGAILLASGAVIAGRLATRGGGE